MSTKIEIRKHNTSEKIFVLYPYTMDKDLNCMAVTLDDPDVKFKISYAYAMQNTSLCTEKEIHDLADLGRFVFDDIYNLSTSEYEFVNMIKKMIAVNESVTESATYEVRLVMDITVNNTISRNALTDSVMDSIKENLSADAEIDIKFCTAKLK